MKHAIAFSIVFCFCALLAAAQGKTAVTQPAQMPRERFEDPELLSFDELVTLSSTPKPEGPLAMPCP
jgi:hypothetical protein